MSGAHGGAVVAGRQLHVHTSIRPASATECNNIQSFKDILISQHTSRFRINNVSPSLYLSLFHCLTLQHRLNSAYVFR